MLYMTTIDDAKDLDLVMPMNDFLKDSSNYSNKTGSLWFYLKDKATNLNIENVNANTVINLSLSSIRLN